MKSLGTMVQELHEFQLQFGFTNEWSDSFVSSIYEKTVGGKETTELSEKQVSKIEQLYAQHCGGL